MSRRSWCILGALGAICAVSPAFARSSVIAQGATKKKQGSVYLSHDLTPGHKYRIDVSAHSSVTFTGNAIEDVTYVYNKRLYHSTKPVTLNGHTSHSFSIKAPVSGKISGWSIVVYIQAPPGKGLSVRLLDLGSGS